MKSFLIRLLGIALACWMISPVMAQQAVTTWQCNGQGTGCPVSQAYPLPVTTAAKPTNTTVVGTDTATLASATYPRVLIYAHSVYVASADVGNRILTMQLLNGSGTIVGDWETTPAMTAGNTYHVEFMAGAYREAAFDAGKTVQTTFPLGLEIPAGYTVKVLDTAAITTNDAETVNFQTIP
jgi:hypothetical protein